MAASRSTGTRPSPRGRWSTRCPTTIATSTTRTTVTCTAFRSLAADEDQVLLSAPVVLREGAAHRARIAWCCPGQHRRSRRVGDGRIDGPRDDPRSLHRFGLPRCGRATAGMILADRPPPRLADPLAQRARGPGATRTCAVAGCWTSAAGRSPTRRSSPNGVTEYVGLEHPDTAHARDRVDVWGDAHDLPFDDGSFDSVLRLPRDRAHRATSRG